MTENEQVEIDALKSRLAALNGEKDRLACVLATHFKNAMRVPETHDSLEEREEVGLSTGIETFRFSSTGETYVFENARDDIPASRFISMQDTELAQYIDKRMLHKEVETPAPDACTAANFEEATDQSLELARLLSTRCKKLAAKQCPHVLEVCASLD